MGSHTITYAGIGLAIALVCLLVGFLWGRSDLKSKIEAALEKASVALDAREFAMRQQLDEAFAEVARLRPLAEELSAVQERLKREQSRYERMRADFGALDAGTASRRANPPEPEPPPTDSADEAIQKLLQSLEAFNAPEGVPAAHSSEALSEPPAAAPTAAQPNRIEPAPAQPVPTAPAMAPAQPQQPRTPAEVAKAAPPPVPAPRPQPPARQQPKPAPLPPQKASPAQPQNLAPAEPRKTAPPPAPKPTSTSKPGQTLDEWQEFARQLEALTGKKK